VLVEIPMASREREKRASGVSRRAPRVSPGRRGVGGPLPGERGRARRAYSRSDPSATTRATTSRGCGWGIRTSPERQERIDRSGGSYGWRPSLARAIAPVADVPKDPAAPVVVGARVVVVAQHPARGVVPATERRHAVVLLVPAAVRAAQQRGGLAAVDRKATPIVRVGAEPLDRPVVPRRGRRHGEGRAHPDRQSNEDRHML
jgi:hypothetical protein